MEILWLSHRDIYHPKAGGAERTIYEVSKRLAILGNAVTIVSSGWKNCQKRETLDSCKIIRVGKYFGVHAAVPIIILKHKFDVIIADLGHAVPWFSPPIFSKRNVVFFRHLHARSLPGQVNSVLARIITGVEKCYFLLYHRAKFVTESTTSIEDLNHLGINNSEIVKIEPGIDLNIFTVGKKTEYPSIIYFGGMRKYKRPEESLTLLSSLIKIFPALKMYMVGDGPELERLKKITKELNLDKSVIFKGRLDTHSLSKLLSKCWLNVHTSKTEGWGLSIIEASASGTPTVAYEVPGVVDTIENEINGIKVKDGTQNALLEAATKILKNPERWWSSSIKVAEKYSWSKTAEKWQELLRALVDID